MRDLTLMLEEPLSDKFEQAVIQAIRQAEKA